MSSPHHLEYSKSSKAKCNGAPPCKGSIISAGALRYGKTVSSEFGDIVRWMHWGCVTPTILGQLAAHGIDRIPHFELLRTEDQSKIRKALAARRVDPADVPMTARHLAMALPPLPAPALPLPTPVPSSSQSSSSSSSVPSQRKRKAAMEAASASASSRGDSTAASVRTAQSTNRLANPSGVTWEEGAQDDDVTEVAQTTEELYTVLNAKIVGVQYYRGLVGVGQQVNLVREPTNRYDRNAIRVMNIQNEQVGHLPRDVALNLSPLLAEKLVTAEGIMNEGNLSGMKYSLSLSIKIYGDASKRNLLEPKLSWATGGRGFQRQTSSTPASSARPPSATVPSRSNAYAGHASYPGSSANHSSTAGHPRAPQISSAEQAARQEELRKTQEACAKAAELRDILNNLEKVNDDNRRLSLLDSLCSTEDMLALPVHPSPPGKASGELTVDLLKHQSQALQWCINAENPVPPQMENGKPIQFWQLKKTGNQSYYYNLATKTPQTAPPTLGRGALCADSMGLGKTLTMLALIIATKSDSQPGFSRSTLIVVPLSIISNWEKQIQDHCTPRTLKYIVYYDKTRGMTPEELAKYDVVITTYQTVAGEHANAQGVSSNDGAPAKKKKKAVNSLFAVQWKRIVLDEGHNIRNERTKMAQAIYALDAQRRWVLTGTPIINSPSDLGSIVRFLRICSPLDSPDYFKRLLLRPLKDGDPSGSEMLRALMAQICIRRTKEMQDSEGNPLVPLPPVEMTVVPVALHDEARQLYERIEELSKARIESFINADSDNPALRNVALTTNALSMLTRLRQLALHPGLIPPDYAQQLMQANENDLDAAMQITPEAKIQLQKVLAQAIEDCEECPICFDTLDNPRITGCSHRFCLACITEVVNRDNRCPMDRRRIGMGDLIEPPPPTELTQAPVRFDDDGDDDVNLHELRHRSSAKINQLLHLLELTPSKEKSLVFSQFTSFLDKIAEALDEAGISYVRFDGQMSARRRQEALETFCVPLSDEDESRAASSTPTTSQGRRTGLRTSKKTLSLDEEVSADNVDEDDFNPELEHSDSDFSDDSGNNPLTARGKKGKGKAKATRFAKTVSKAGYSNVPRGGNPKVMLISLKAGALGLNLTVANNVYLMDPWWQEGIESQAIDRCNRIGQTRPVHVYQLIAENTVESKVIDIQEKKKALVKEAFSGMKNRETQRQKKEARLQDIIQLFGIRRAENQAPRPGPRQATLQFEVVE